MIETFLKESDINGVKVYKTYTNIANLKLDPRNPRDIEEDKLEDLMDFIAKYGQLKPNLVDIRPDKEGQQIGGNQRLKAYQRLGYVEVWIEPRDPMSDAQAFEMGTLDNMQFGQYLEDPLKELVRQYNDEIETAKLQIETQVLNLSDLLKPAPFNTGKMKYEIIIKCDNEEDLHQKMIRLSEVGLSGKKRGK